MSDADQPTSLTSFQLEAAAVFFQLPASQGFLLAGGAALAAQHLTTRPTQDLDFFTSPGRGEVPAARDEFIAAARTRGWKLQIIRDELTFCRIQITGADELLIDIALDATPGHPPVTSIAGPTLDPSELAGRKVIALFDRAAARDFVDVFVLSSSFGKDELLRLAAEVDAGFDLQVLADMFDMLVRYTDRDLSLGTVDPSAVRKFFADWADQIRTGPAP
ncbi:nucleotidyl transferase AbiEii/AbiGii toxin family protein [Jatrophihabitans lederbergiae]|uniref:Nucleotidyl transferase AbiEii/AbiGii toxin family protein n=1 Tax=Jatrophihabitans lederbergiae TaxID=3075547 RepID=A0ABU2J6Y2_9ACTN|nr:nucleotidyl transferase AbiEii/AbiGii toxin family protein [Jatrophihabitans sp. DSM 44399]MDT0260755.1 nucleotidyl transferase AbiEii/AbiGii toxin family protein [Jatrophihabitans sp. DSM 44399]